MMETVQLEAQSRDVKHPAKRTRLQNLIPGVCYGKNEDSQPVQFDYQTFRKAFIKAGNSQLIDLTIDGKKKMKVLVHDVQFHPITGKIHHVDLLHVNLKQEVTTDIQVEIVGVSPAVKDLGGVLNTVKHQVAVKALPMDLPHNIEVDISTLTEISSAVHVSDLKLGDKIHILDNPEDVIVIVNAPRVQEEELPVTLPEAATAELAGKESKEESEEKSE